MAPQLRLPTLPRQHHPPIHQQGLLRPAATTSIHVFQFVGKSSESVCGVSHIRKCRLLGVDDEMRLHPVAAAVADKGLQLQPLLDLHTKSRTTNTSAAGETQPDTHQESGRSLA
jgi:hypothetical protein